MTGSDDRFKAWAAVENDAESGEDGSVPAGVGGSPYREHKGRRFAAVVYWRRHLISLTGRRGVLELKDVPDHTATLTDKRGEVVFSFPLGELRVRRSWPYCFTIEHRSQRWRLWGIGVNSLKGAERQLEVMKRDHVFTILPPPPGMDKQQYRRLMTSKLAQQKLWRELWLIGLGAFGAQRVD
jgi:hypothetical protein